MKKYLAFYGDVYYPIGGMDDFLGEYDTKEEAIEAIEESHKLLRPTDLVWEWSWASIWDTQEKIEVYSKNHN